MSNPREKEYIVLEGIKHRDENGTEYWLARELAPVLEYTKWDDFSKVIGRAMIACRYSGFNIDDQFAEVGKLIEHGSGAERGVTDYKLSRYACYLIVQNGDPRKEVPFEIPLGIPNAVTLVAMQEIEDMIGGKAPKYSMSVDDFLREQ